ncbi:myb-like protein X isoform X2 [Quillaja saponaria]|uniref:Myb-like protein X isoform X2 n=1 Tax=Quillaja saponaria TaxID=32244 RepID=A0AAD7QCS1_QUISA|nr:myb-like protein X isoform X2 [Quillaja saponaria]
MSRCFPFPPPGYEKKARTDDVDLLKKEKQREKKHKKERREKEKKEGKEKRGKERSDGKHREKKDKKEKHREKKKDKEKDRDKDKNSTADEKRILVSTEVPNADRLIQKDNNSISFEEKFTRQHAGYNGERLNENTHVVEEIKDSKFVHELGRRIKDEGGGAGNQSGQKFSITDHKKDEGTVRLVAKGTGISPEGKEKFKDKTIDNRKFDGQGIPFEVRPGGNAMVQNQMGKFHPGVEGIPRLLEKNFERKQEEKEKIKEKKGDDRRGDKGKDKDKKKKGHGKDKDRDKEKKKEEKAKEKTEHKNTKQEEEKVREKTEHKNTKQDKLKESIKAAPIDTKSYPQLPKDSNSVTEGNLKKRKDIESNGVLHANDNWPSKLPRPSPSSHPFIENGRILEHCQTSAPSATDGQGASTALKVENKERNINGIIEARPSSGPSSKTTVAAAPADQIAEASVKQPHPDSKYLSQVYLVPKLEGWSDFDDEEWLFGCSSSQLREPQMKSSEVGEVPQVWAEALQIEPADICALPYVIPY